MDREILEKRVREKLGETVGIAWVEELLKKDIVELLSWLQEHRTATDPTLCETLYHAQLFRHGIDNRSTVLLGLRILQGELRCELFVLDEIRKRIEAIEAEANEYQEQKELPGGPA